MVLEVILEGLFFPIRPLTMRTREWQGCLAFVVTKEVSFKRFLFRENFITLLTGEKLLMRFRVALQFTFQVKNCVAFFTGQQLCCLGLNMFLFDIFLFSVVECRN